MPDGITNEAFRIRLLLPLTNCAYQLKLKPCLTR